MDVKELDDAAAAVRAIGTNAVPLLLEWGSAETPTWRREVHTLLISYPKFFRWEWMYRAVDIGKGVRQANHAEKGLEILGTNALPCLKTFMTNSNPTIRSSASNTVYWLEHFY